MTKANTKAEEKGRRRGESDVERNKKWMKAGDGNGGGTVERPSSEKDSSATGSPIH